MNIIKKIKIGKLFVPKVTVYFTISIIILSVVLFFATKPKKNKNHNKKNDEDNE